MAHEFTTAYLKDAISLFQYYKGLAERAMAQCPDEGLVAEIDAESNSIATIVKHLSGNMRSRWTDFLTTDGEKENRNRDSEFELPCKTRAELYDQWDSGWKCVFAALAPLQEEDLAKMVTIRKEPHSVMQAVNRQIAHYAYHVGQMVYLSRHFSGGDWKSLTVPRKQSGQFNADVAAGVKSQR